MGFWNRSKYKKRDNWDWWNDQDDYYSGRYDQEDDTTDPANPNYVPTYTGGGSSYNSGSYGGYYSGWYKPKYDMSISLETRVIQLIKTITGKSLRLRQSSGWGNDDKFFYYNPKDLENSTDDEVLGRILHQLAKELHIDIDAVEKINKQDPDYRHLVNTLEDNRADKQLQSRYPGVGYYAEEVWHERKFTDNPMSHYTEPIPIEQWVIEQWVEETWRGDVGIQAKILKELKRSPKGDIATDIRNKYDEYKQQLEGQQNDAWEFCFNINAFQNSEKEFDFTKDKVADNFTKALPFIDEYLKAETLEDAMKVYPDIKKYYPKPDKQQQQQMDNQMQQTEGLTAQDMKKMQQQAMREIERAENGVDGEELINMRAGVDEDDDADSSSWGMEEKERIIERNLAQYKQYRNQNAGAIANLHALIRSILQDNAIRRYQAPFKRGKLNGKSIYKLLATDNLRIFKKPKVVSDRKYTMAIVVDTSGSMSGSNSSYAVQGAIILAEVFEQLGLPYEILGFSSDTYIFKKFDAPLRREIIPALDAEFSGGGTDDHAAIKLLKDHMVKFDPSNTYHKGLFVISDGDGHGQRTKELVTEIETNHNATVFGIGIGDMSERELQNTYNHYLRVGNVKDLPNELITLMRGQFRRHG